MKHKRPSNILSWIKVRHQLYIIFFAAIFIPVLGLGNYLIYNSRATLTDHYKEQAHSDNLRVRSLLLDLTYNVSLICQIEWNILVRLVCTCSTIFIPDIYRLTISNQCPKTLSKTIYMLIHTQV